MGIDWGEKSAKSFGNGIIRISLMDFIKIIATVSAITLGWNDLKTRAVHNSSKIDDLSNTVFKLNNKIDEISDKVLVLETVAKTTKEIKSGVRTLQNSEIFDPDVTQIKVRKIDAIGR